MNLLKIITSLNVIVNNLLPTCQFIFSQSSHEMFLFMKALRSPRSLESNLAEYIPSLRTGEPRGIPASRARLHQASRRGGQAHRGRPGPTTSPDRQASGEAGPRSRGDVSLQVSVGPSSAGDVAGPGWFPQRCPEPLSAAPGRKGAARGCTTSETVLSPSSQAPRKGDALLCIYRYPNTPTEPSFHNLGRAINARKEEQQRYLLFWQY